MGEGLVQSLARPGANVTGVSTLPGREVEGKRLQLLCELNIITSYKSLLKSFPEPIQDQVSCTEDWKNGIETLMFLPTILSSNVFENIKSVAIGLSGCETINRMTMEQECQKLGKMPKEISEKLAEAGGRFFTQETQLPLLIIKDLKDLQKLLVSGSQKNRLPMMRSTQ